MTECKKNFIFVSDFDGTLSGKDFYQIIIDEYLGDKGRELYKVWKDGGYLDIDFLQIIYKSINRTEKEIMQDILSIPFDEDAKDFISWIKACGGDFLILSAGTSYYIERLLDAKGILNVPIISNHGYYKDKGIHLKVDANNEYYSRRYGVDKAKVIEKLKTRYEKVYFAGDSEPDVAPSLLADLSFAKSSLQKLLAEKTQNFISVNNFKEIQVYLKENLLL